MQTPARPCCSAWRRLQEGPGTWARPGTVEGTGADAQVCVQGAKRCPLSVSGGDEGHLCSLSACPAQSGSAC